ncbi:hypothetical protein F4811DRAFT_472895 [Daldinia bambusicola]|nr:hypothetical protein F4811DRAFT_472895 [Daldinia bambusicola]
MSGFEIAGIVLAGAPVATGFFEKCQELMNVRKEYRECEFDLRCHKALFKGHLEQLLSDFIEDQDRIAELLSDPGGHHWHNRNIEEVLLHRLGEESHKLFMDCIEHTNDSLKALDDELALESGPMQDFLRKPKAKTFKSRLRQLATNENFKFQVYKVKFGARKNSRSRIFEKLKSYDSKLEGLLKMSVKGPAVAQDDGPIAKPDNAGLCSFWIQANAFFGAVASAWSCDCREPHMAKLLLEHRTSKEKKFTMLFATQAHSSWSVQRTMIVECDDGQGQPTSGGQHTLYTTMSALSYEPHHKVSIPVKPAMKRMNSQTTPNERRPKMARIHTLSVPQNFHGSLISSLCDSLSKGTDDICGYICKDNYRYYVHKISSQQAEAFVTIDQILRKEIAPLPSRRKRYKLSFILASSFLQLIDTPWLPDSWKRSDIVFVNNEKDVLDQPHLKRGFTDHTKPEASQDPRQLSPNASNNLRSSKASRSLELLGIILLELCFGKLLEDQPYRKNDWPAGEDNKQRELFDLVAAQKWSDEVNDEAGNDFDQAIRWCLEGHHNTKPEKLRHEMLRRVVEPLEKCHRYLFQE